VGIPTASQATTFQATTRFRSLDQRKCCDRFDPAGGLSVKPREEIANIKQDCRGQAMMTPKKPDPVDVEVGHRIRIQRLQSGLSQTSLAEQLGVTFQQVQKYEKGVNRVGAGRLTKIANVVGVPVGTLFGAHDENTIARSDRGTASSPLKLLTVFGALRLLRAYGQLNDGQMRRFIVELVENIAAGRR
jgi:transcriptional regulator with XRE-family HTH domain